jgi:hypothetical protein
VSVVINEFEVVPRPERPRDAPPDQQQQQQPEAPPANRDHEIAKTLQTLHMRALRLRAD